MRRVLTIHLTRMYIVLIVVIFLCITVIYYKHQNRLDTLASVTVIHKTCSDTWMHQMLRTFPATVNWNDSWLPRAEMIKRLEAIQDGSNYPQWHKQTCADLCNIQLEQFKSHSVQMNGTQVYDGDNTKPIPVSCTIKDKGGTAIIIPVEQGVQSLQSLIKSLNKLLQTQKLCYRIFLVEHTRSKDDRYKNLGMLMNVGFVEAAVRFETTCTIFHDPRIKLDSENPGHALIPHYCNVQTNQGPVHMSVLVNKQLSPSRSLSGVLRIRPKHFISVNGFSNWYWNISGVYEDFERRIRATGLHYDHEDLDKSQYIDLSLSSNYFDEQDLQNNTIAWFLIDHATQRISRDGLRQLHYRVVSIDDNTDFTHIVVEFKQKPFCSTDVS